jgi:hypothetical protein
VITVHCDPCARRSIDTVLPGSPEPLALAIGSISGELDVCDPCRHSATLGEIAACLAELEPLPSNKPKPVRKGALVEPCPLCAASYSSGTGVWQHLTRDHGIDSRIEREHVWGAACFFGCGETGLGGARGLSRHMTVHGAATLFLALAQVRDLGDPHGLAQGVLDRLSGVDKLDARKVAAVATEPRPGIEFEPRGPSGGHADDWLRAFLSERGGSALSSEIRPAATQAGYGKDGLRAARRRLGIEQELLSSWPHRYIWALPAATEAGKGELLPTFASP